MANLDDWTGNADMVAPDSSNKTDERAISSQKRRRLATARASCFNTIHEAGVFDVRFRCAAN
jgi:hypothetical protein